MRGIWNIVFGLVFIIGGLTGKLALISTNSGPALAGLGLILLVWGGVQMAKGSQAAE